MMESERVRCMERVHDNCSDVMTDVDGDRSGVRNNFQSLYNLTTTGDSLVQTISHISGNHCLPFLSYNSYQILETVMKQGKYHVLMNNSLIQIVLSSKHEIIFD